MIWSAKDGATSGGFPYERAGGFQALDLIVLGDERILKLNKKRGSPVEALEAFREMANQGVARKVRDEIKGLANLATNIRLDGKLSPNAAAKVGTVDGIRNLMISIMSDEVACVR